MLGHPGSRAHPAAWLVPDRAALAGRTTSKRPERRCWTATAPRLPAVGHRRPESWGRLGRGEARAVISQYDHWHLLCLGVAKDQFASREQFVRPSGV